MARLVLASVCCLWLAGCTGGVALGPDAVKGKTPDGTIEEGVPKVLIPC